MSVSSIQSTENSGVSRLRRTNRRTDSTVLVAVNDLQVADEIRFHLQAGGHPVWLSQTTRDALAAARSRRPSVIVLDRVLNGEDGLSVVEALRREENFTPVLMVGPPSSVDDRIRGFKAGADQFLVKPFDVRELAARVEALLRRASDPRSQLQFGDLEMDLVERTVRCAGRSVDLLPTEFKLLEYLMRHPGEALSRAKLLEDVWNSRFDTRSNVVDVQIGNLRRKLDPSGERQHIISIRAIGFMLKDASEDEFGRERAATLSLT
jgi:two-component system, OmpR family, response regulator